MSDYISRKAVLEALVTWGAKYEAPNTRELADAIEALPKAPVLTKDEASMVLNGLKAHNWRWRG